MPLTVDLHRNAKARCGLPLGGIGAGWFELRADGTTARWNIANNRPLGWGPAFPYLEHSMLFFMLRWVDGDGEPRMKLFQIEESHNVAGLSTHEIQYIMPWLTGIERIRYEASFPFARMEFRDPEMPCEVDLEAWSPFIPHDAKNSSLPGAFFDFTIRPLAAHPQKFWLMASLRNPSAFDIPERVHTARIVTGEGWRGFEAGSGQVDPKHITLGTVGLSGLDAGTKCFLGWAHPHHFHERLVFEQDFPECDNTEGCNRTDKETGRREIFSEFCWNTAAVEIEVPSDGPATASFALAWHFPNNHGRDPNDGADGGETTRTDGHPEGHYYNNFFQNSADVCAYLAANRRDLLARTRAFHEAFSSSTAPGFLLDQVNSQLATMVTSSWFTDAGQFGIIEGLSPTRSYAGLSTVDVALYGSPLYAALFPELSRSVNRAYAHLQRENGIIAHSILFDFERAADGEANGHRLDLPAQFAILSLRDFFWSGDTGYLRAIYPHCRAALEYALRERDPNRDGMPDMEGIMCSYDNFPMFGVSSFVAGFYLLAYRMMAAAAAHLGEPADSARYGDLFERGRSLFEKELWNGDYYRLCNQPGGRGPDEGCLSDQLLAEWVAHQCGMGPLFDPGHKGKALQSILRMNYRSWQGLRNCQWPGEHIGHRPPPEIWVDQANTCWTGVEYAFGALLLYEGQVEEALHLLKTCDDRHRRSGMYFDHQEFGGHYFRPMSAWSILPALLGLEIQNGEYVFAPRLPGQDQRLFFAVPEGWGRYEREVSGSVETIRVTVLNGAIPFKTLRFQILTPGHATATVDGLTAAASRKDDWVCVETGGRDCPREIVVRCHPQASS